MLSLRADWLLTVGLYSKELVHWIQHQLMVRLQNLIPLI